MAAVVAANGDHVPAYGADPVSRGRGRPVPGSISEPGPRSTWRSTGPEPTWSDCSRCSDRSRRSSAPRRPTSTWTNAGPRNASWAASWWRWPLLTASSPPSWWRRRRADRRRAPCATPAGVDHPVHRSGHVLPGGRGRRFGRVGSRSGHVASPGWGPAVQCSAPFSKWGSGVRVGRPGSTCSRSGGPRTAPWEPRRSCRSVPGEHLRLRYVRKQSMQLASKTRFIAAQFSCLLTDGLWYRNAGHANAMARRLAEGSPGWRG